MKLGHGSDKFLFCQQARDSGPAALPARIFAPTASPPALIVPVALVIMPAVWRAGARDRMDWIVLIVAGLFEVVWAISLKYSDNFSRPLPTVIALAGMVISIVLLSLALRTLPVGTAYAVWTGIGAVGTALVGMLVLGEPAETLRLMCIGLIIAGVIGLRLVSGH